MGPTGTTPYGTGHNANANPQRITSHAHSPDPSISAANRPRLHDDVNTGEHNPLTTADTTISMPGLSARASLDEHNGPKQRPRPLALDSGGMAGPDPSNTTAWQMYGRPNMGASFTSRSLLHLPFLTATTRLPMRRQGMQQVYPTTLRVVTILAVPRLLRLPNSELVQHLGRLSLEYHPTALHPLSYHP